MRRAREDEILQIPEVPFLLQFNEHTKRGIRR